MSTAEGGDQQKKSAAGKLVSFVKNNQQQLLNMYALTLHSIVSLTTISLTTFILCW